MLLFYKHFNGCNWKKCLFDIREEDAVVNKEVIPMENKKYKWQGSGYECLKKKEDHG